MFRICIYVHAHVHDSWYVCMHACICECVYVCARTLLNVRMCMCLIRLYPDSLCQSLWPADGIQKLAVDEEVLSSTAVIISASVARNLRLEARKCLNATAKNAGPVGV